MNDPRVIARVMDPLSVLLHASTSKPEGVPGRRPRYRTLAHPGQLCSKCGGCEATFNIDWKPFCDSCHTYEHEQRRLTALIDHYKLALARETGSRV